jgi:hypothetical protein
MIGMFGPPVHFGRLLLVRVAVVDEAQVLRVAVLLQVVVKLIIVVGVQRPAVKVVTWLVDQRVMQSVMMAVQETRLDGHIFTVRLRMS